MRFSILTAIVGVMVLSLAISTFAVLAAPSASWASGTSRGSACDNPGFKLLANETERLILNRGFIPCSRPKSIEDYGSLHGRWFRSEKYPRVYAFVYSDTRYYAANVFASSSLSSDSERELRRYTDNLLGEFKRLWDHEQHELQEWTDAGADVVGEPCNEAKSSRPD